MVVRSADRPGVERAVRRYARQMRQLHPEIRRVIWFGSWVSGTPTPGSDVDICLIVDETAAPARQRPSKYLPAGFPTGVDLVVYTAQEFELLAESRPRWRKALAAGVEL